MNDISIAYFEYFALLLGMALPFISLIVAFFIGKTMSKRKNITKRKRTLFSYTFEKGGITLKITEIFVFLIIIVGFYIVGGILVIF
ncbi:hypothetical protein [Neobacillus sp. LXY-1]|uniref:hypothetical protein n=1 Tax=Neobacillus sp. LXY-1 TaxID=3379133 RepID=UPI003EE32AC5